MPYTLTLPEVCIASNNQQPTANSQQPTANSHNTKLTTGITQHQLVRAYHLYLQINVRAYHLYLHAPALLLKW